MRSPKSRFTVLGVLAIGLVGCSASGDLRTPTGQAEQTPFDEDQAEQLVEALGGFALAAQEWSSVATMDQGVLENAELSRSRGEQAMACPHDGSISKTIEWESKLTNAFGERVMGPGDEARIRFDACEQFEGMAVNGEKRIFLAGGYYDPSHQEAYLGNHQLSEGELERTETDISDRIITYSDYEAEDLVSDQPRCFEGSVRVIVGETGTTELRIPGGLYACVSPDRGETSSRVQVHSAELTLSSGQVSGEALVSISDEDNGRVTAHLDLENVSVGHASPGESPIEQGDVQLTGAANVTHYMRYRDGVIAARDWSQEVAEQ